MKSLQEQLLNAGLADEKKAKVVAKSKHKQEKLARKSQGKKGKNQTHSTKLVPNRNVERDRELNRLKHLSATEKAVAAQIKQIIQLNMLDLSDGEHSYNFAYKGKVKSIIVSESVRNSLSYGRLAIVQLIDGKSSTFQVIPKGAADKVVQRDESVVIHLAADVEPLVDESDPYAEFKVPDDLMW